MSPFLIFESAPLFAIYQMKILCLLCATLLVLSTAINAHQTIEEARLEFTEYPSKVASVPLNGAPTGGNGIYIVLSNIRPARFRLVNVDADVDVAFGINVAVCTFAWKQGKVATISPNKKIIGHLLPAPEWWEADHWWYILRTDEFIYRRKVLRIEYLGERNLNLEIEIPTGKGPAPPIERWWQFRDDILINDEKGPLFPLTSWAGESSQSTFTSGDLLHQVRQQDKRLKVLEAELRELIAEGCPLNDVQQKKLEELQLELFEYQDTYPQAATESKEFQEIYRGLQACIR